ncbi:Xaa-Pro peptidase family protein [Vulcanisaeta distributa]|uniref:M24 family metallopeptidase n=1 Tax=Vulcanisaeta distributa TaxID=164451 RepID=UPI0006CF8386|nr:Xaa-Pro peptidase family protein [Vulcanisaeta distributa]
MLNINRINGLINELRRKSVELAVVTPGPNFRYLVGSYIETFERFGALMICTGNGAYALVLPRLDEGKAKATGLPYIVYGDEEGPLNAIKVFINGNCGAARRVGLEGRATLNYLWILRRVIGEFSDYSIDDLLTSMRISKDEGELRNIERAVRAIEDGIKAAHETIKPGMTELDIAKVISDAIGNAGAEPRDVLVQSGPNSAIPHWVPSRRRVEVGDVVVIDVTATYNDYYGDLTRTFVIGNPPGDFWRIYNLVKKAHDEAIAGIKEGVTGAYVDSIARRVITEGGYGGEYFIHRTGHGIGLEVHEEPFISQSYDKALPRGGSTFTIEPGIYLPGKFGVRLESNVVIKPGGIVEVLDKYWPEVVVRA